MSQEYFLEAFAGGPEPVADFDPGIMDTPDVAAQEFPVQAPAPAPAIVGTWSWTPSAMLWTAGGVLMVGFVIWFLMSFNAAKARALAEEVTGDE